MPSHSPTVAIDVRTADYTGIGRCVRSALPRLAQMDTGLRFVAIANPSQDLSWLPSSDALDVLPLPRDVPLYSPREHWALPKALRQSGCDLAHFTNFNTPWKCPVPFVVTIHDVIYWRFPWDLGSRLRARYAKLLMERAARTAAHVVTVSEHSAKDLEQYLRIPPDRITVVPNGAWQTGEMPEPGPDELALAQAHAPYVLYVGSQNPHKNLAGLADAVGLVREAHPRIKLLAVGKRGRHFDKLARELRRRGLADVVEFAHHVSDELLVALYRRAAVVATASLYEGFGLPVLEAFAVGAAVVCANRSSLPEVAGHAALLADPENPREFADKIQSVLADSELRQRLIDRGRERAKLFTWDRNAQQLADVYRRLLS